MSELSPCTSWTRSNCKKKIVLIERICYKNIHLLLPNTDCLQQVEYSVRGCTWQLKNIKTIYRFNKLVFDRVDNSFECFNWATHHYGLCQPDSVKYHAKERRFLSLSRLTRKNNERRGMLCRYCLKGGLILSLYVIAIFSLAISYISSIYFGVKC